MMNYYRYFLQLLHIVLFNRSYLFNEDICISKQLGHDGSTADHLEDRTSEPMLQCTICKKKMV